ncbi:hypothetical protein FA95DRAFT_1223195 [Auriscalpium vulgare]|uniref:Uncharacterized protein n=1 Tax=Auriscalpium vulgare TaxID=40419 RepID=A0ACB8RV44_9AGAM|nr:hypothetical protein FA95DRAFT_1223195 [Auriscalpium vulgare]
MPLAKLSSLQRHLAGQRSYVLLVTVGILSHNPHIYPISCGAPANPCYAECRIIFFSSSALSTASVGRVSSLDYNCDAWLHFRHRSYYANSNLASATLGTRHLVELTKAALLGDHTASLRSR